VMSLLLSVLPPPKFSSGSVTVSQSDNPVKASVKSSSVPVYGSEARRTYVPVTDDDLGDGGALPEVHTPQYPLGMGRKDHQRRLNSTAVVQLQSDATGNAKYDAILRQEVRSDVVVYASPADLVPKSFSQDQLAKPSEQEIAEITDKTRAALEAATNTKIAASRPRTRADLAAKGSDVSYVRYKPSTSDQTGIEERIVKIQEVAIDPLEPPKFRHKKAPARPPSPPVPIMHSPPKKVSKEELAEWKIPQCISNWKNLKGYTIPIDQRLAADGRGLIEVSPILDSSLF
jgi:SNW domain-containing protein 1